MITEQSPPSPPLTHPPLTDSELGCAPEFTEMSRSQAGQPMWNVVLADCALSSIGVCVCPRSDHQLS